MEDIGSMSTGEHDDQGGEFAGRVALVTGASRGLGRAVALLLARRGADLVITSRHVGPLETVGDEARASGSTVVIVPADVGTQSGREFLVERALAEIGRVDLFVANATNQDIYLGVPTETQWDADFSVDLLGAVRTTDLLLPSMKARGVGSIVFVSSVSGKTGTGGAVDAGYGSMKAALIAAAKIYALDLAKDGVRVNSVAPGTFYDPTTPIWATLGADLIEGIRRTIPLGRLGRSSEIAEAICFLLSDRASFVTGHCLVADGGQYPGIA